MAKKSTQWVTIPEASIHTPVSGAQKSAAPKKGENPDFVKNKWFWGIGFLVVVAASFAVLAPAQFSSLLKGNLFESTGLPEGQTSGVLSPLSLLPTETPAAETPATPAEPAVAEVKEVVAPQEKPVNVAVEPISTPEEVKVEPVKPAVSDCGTEIPCFTPHLKDCSLAKTAFAFTFAGQSIESNLEITGMEGENCLTQATLTKSPLADLVGKSATCKLAKGDYNQESLQAIVGDPATLAQTCSGSLVDALKGLVPVPVANNQDKQVEDLLRQIQELQSQKEESTKMMQDLVNIVQEQKQEGVRPAAPAPATTVQPGFRANPYRVSVTPEQMLNQRSAGGSVVVPQQTAAYQQPAMQTYQPAYQPVRGANTPQTGPEQIAIVLMAGFVSVVLWKFTRTFAR
ncbi:hypothetical protein HZA44_02130 [Candidatus Peregrinibacteria bacterium]|nr:hypothetical protein [Candidatus Peregrinibacteria bacterium]